MSDELEALVSATLAARLGEAPALQLMAELTGRAEELGENVVAGVNPPRRDFGEAWELARGGAYFETQGVGAVHLELGSWRAFGPERVRNVIEVDGLSEFIRLDSDDSWDCELVADARAMPLRSASVDRIASNSTLEHIPHPHKVLEESHRVLRPGGLMEVVMPFVWHEHGYPEDHVRLTRGFFERVLGEIGFVDVNVDHDCSSGLYYAIHQASKMAEIDAGRPESQAMRDIQVLVNEMLGLLIPLDRYFVDGSREWYQSVRVIARKAGTYEPSRRARDREGGFVDRCLDLLADPASKQPLALDGRQLAASPAGPHYRCSSDSVNFLEPHGARRPLGQAMKSSARRAMRRN